MTVIEQEPRSTIVHVMVRSDPTLNPGHRITEFTADKAAEWAHLYGPANADLTQPVTLSAPRGVNGPLRPFGTLVPIVLEWKHRTQVEAAAMCADQPEGEWLYTPFTGAQYMTSIHLAALAHEIIGVLAGEGEPTATAPGVIATCLHDGRPWLFYSPDFPPQT